LQLLLLQLLLLLNLLLLLLLELLLLMEGLLQEQFDRRAARVRMRLSFNHRVAEQGRGCRVNGDSGGRVGSSSSSRLSGQDIQLLLLLNLLQLLKKSDLLLVDLCEQTIVRYIKYK
jgi:hypothetical protein